MHIYIYIYKRWGKRRRHSKKEKLAVDLKWYVLYIFWFKREGNPQTIIFFSVVIFKWTNLISRFRYMYLYVGCLKMKKLDCKTFNLFTAIWLYNYVLFHDILWSGSAPYMYILSSLEQFHLTLQIFIYWQKTYNYFIKQRSIYFMNLNNSLQRRLL